MNLTSLLILILFTVITAFSGRVLLDVLRINYKNEILNFLIGFLLIESFSLIVFIILGLLGYKNFLFAFIPNILFVLISVFYFFNKNNSFSFNFQYPILWKASLFLFLTITGLYFLNGSELFFNVLNSSGVIYQDIIYHGGISQSIINFGYPVYDLQFKGKLLSYHFFTHFLAAKISYISFSNVFISYHIFLNLLGILVYSFLSISFFQIVFYSSGYKFKGKYHEIIIALSGFCAFWCTFWIGGFLNNSFISAFYLSSSFQWQLIMMLVFFLIAFNNAFSKISLKHMIVLAMLLFTATLIKVSSLPLIISGFGAVLLYNLIFLDKRKIQIWTQLLLILIVTGVISFISFFQVGASQSSTLEFNIDLLKLTPIIAFFKINSLILSILIYLISVVSFRFILIYKLKKSETWFVGSILLSGLVLSLLVKDNQVYFIFPAIILSSHLAITYLLKTNLKKLILLLFLFFLFFSFYPIGGLGVTLKDKFEKKSHYYELNAKRLELYSWLRNNSNKNEVFFTTSHYASPDMMADNYAPAAFSGRKTFLGGFRFGGIEYEDDFHKRLELTKNFSLDDKKVWNLLRKENIKYVLIEKIGNFDKLLYDKVKNDINPAHYRLVFKNTQGLIFQVVESNNSKKN
ncbi:hypothetical protein ACWBC2_11225 [Salegentibacter agarivorans]